MHDFFKLSSKNMYRIENGILLDAKQVPSPNFNDRSMGETLSLLVIHNISLPEGCFGNGCVASFFQNNLDVSIDVSLEKIKDLRVSAHLFISRNGEVIQFVNLNKRAWHAGVSHFNGKENCNDFSIGIELEGTDYLPFEDIQYKVLAEVSQSISEAYPLINPENTVGHSEIAPGRKTDPGPFFEWKKYKKIWSELA